MKSKRILRPVRGRGKQRESLGSTRSGSGSAGLLFSLGVLAVLGGVALAAAPRMGPEAGWYAKQLGRMGITSGPIIASGMVVFALGVVSVILARLSARVTHREPEPEADTGLVLGQLADDFSGLRENVARVQLEFAELLETNRTLLRVTRDQAKAATESQLSNDALFRLAASLDQVSARLEQRMDGEFGILAERFQRLGESVDTGREEFLNKLSETQIHAMPQAVIEALSDEVLAAAEDLQLEDLPDGCVDLGDPDFDFEFLGTTDGEAGAELFETEPVIEFEPCELPPLEEELHVYVTLEEEEEPTEDSSLGLLDGFDDNGDFHAEGTRPELHLSRPPSHQDLSLNTAPRAPSRPPASEPPTLVPKIDETASPAPSDGGEPERGEVIDELKNLLSDDSIDDVLENIRREKRD